MAATFYISLFLQKNCRQRKIDKENNLRAQLETLQATHEQLLLRFTKLDSEVAAIQST